MYRDFRQYLFAPFAVTLTLRTNGDPMRLAAAVQKEIRAVSPDQVISDVQTMEKLVWESSSRPRFYTLLLAVFGGLALLLAMTGLYGVLSYVVSRRTREIGIRMALGASGSMVFRHVMRGALLLVFAGVVLGIAGSLALTRLIAAQLYHTRSERPGHVRQCCFYVARPSRRSQRSVPGAPRRARASRGSASQRLRHCRRSRAAVGLSRGDGPCGPPPPRLSAIRSAFCSCRSLVLHHLLL